MLILGLAGKAKSGKDTFIECARKIINNPIQRIAFADALKEEVSKATGYSVETINIHKDMFRPILQWWGTDFRRKFHGTNYWIEKLNQKILVDHGNVVIIPDVRFKNEVDYIQSLNGIMIKISRPVDSGNHSSEIDLDNMKFKHTIHNNSSIAAFQSTIEVLLHSIADTYGYKLSFKV